MADVRRLLLLALLLVPALPALAQAPIPTAATAVAALIPDGPVTAEILTPAYPPRMQELSRKLINAAQANPQWFQAWAASHPKGSMPWHPNLGLSRPEYDEYMREGRRSSFTVRSRGVLTFTRIGTRPAWKLGGWGVLGPIDGLTLDITKAEVVSPRWGRLPWLGISQPDDPNVPLPWRWYGVWKAQHQVGDPRRGGQAMSASLHIGPLGEDGQVGMYWTARRFNGGRRLADEFLLLRFPGRR